MIAYQFTVLAFMALINVNTSLRIMFQCEHDYLDAKQNLKADFPLVETNVYKFVLNELGIAKQASISDDARKRFGGRGIRIEQAGFQGSGVTIELQLWMYDHFTADNIFFDKVDGKFKIKGDIPDLCLQNTAFVVDVSAGAQYKCSVTGQACDKPFWDKMKYSMEFRQKLKDLHKKDVEDELNKDSDFTAMLKQVAEEKNFDSGENLMEALKQKREAAETQAKK